MTSFAHSEFSSTHACGTAVTPNISFSTAMHLATMTSSLIPSIIELASPATKASSTGTFNHNVGICIISNQKIGGS